MKFTIEIEDFWMHDECDLQQELEKHVTSEVVRQIYKKIEEKVNETITRQVKESVEKNMLRKINKIISDFIDNGKIESHYSSDPDLSVEEYIKKRFNSNNGWGNPHDQIEKAAKRFGEQLRERYDVVFATQIVKSLDAKGLLKDEVANMLLQENIK